MAYNSKSGHSTLAGHFSGLLMGWTTRSKRRVKCDDHGHSKSDHDCRKNFEGSSKAMEPDMAVELIANNPLLAETNVRIKTLIGDDDSSTIAAVRRAVSHPIEKWSDLNHAKKSVTTALYGITNSDKIRTYFAHTFVATLKKHKDDASAVERELKCVVDHAFGDHGACNDSQSCRTLGTDYVYEGLPHKKPLSDPELRASLVKIFSKAANNAAKLAPCGSTQINENANNMVAYKHPKNYHFAGSASFDYRVAAAVCQKNVGPEYTLAVYEKLNLPRGEETEKFRAKRAKSRATRATKQKSLEYKRKRARNKQTQRRRNTAAENREGITYSTDCGLDAVSDAFQVYSPDEKLNFDEVIPVVFDLETSGLSKSAEICQIAAVEGDDVFNVYIVPSRGMTNGASNVNGLTVVAGEMFLHEERLTTKPIRTAIIDFVEYLRSVSDGKGIILVAHNGSRLNAPMILRTVKENGLLREFSNVVKGFADTLPIFRRIMPDRRKEKKRFNQESLATDFLGPSAADGAHNAVRDVQILAQLIHATGVTSMQIKEEAKTISEITNSQLLKATHDIIKIGLEPLKNGASPMIRSRIAKAGITYEILKNTFKTGGGESVKMLLAEDVGGRPRVSKQTKILTAIIEELVRLQK